MPSAARAVTYRRDHVLGTSLDLTVAARDPDRVEAAVLAELGRVERVFSLRDPDSELARFNSAAGAVPASVDLRAVLAAYARVMPPAGGALHPLAAVGADLAGPGWACDGDAVTRTTRNPLDLNAGAKGYALDRAAAAARAAGATAGLVNLGGDLAAWGDRAWAVGVQNPFDPADNARPLGAFRVRNASVATSGGYLRRGHLLDPRTGRPADAVASATVVAADSLTANLLATTLAVLDPVAGMALLARVPGASGYVIDADGRRFAGGGFELLPVEPVRRRGFRRVVAAGALAVGVFAAADPASPLAATAAAQDTPAKGEPWPAGFQMTVQLEIPTIAGGKRYRRPYVAVWVEDAAGKAVRTLTVWGNDPRWTKDLSDWWKIGKGQPDLIKAVTRATRGPGKYELAWDGKDDAGVAVGRGEYTVRVEVHREHGKHVRQSGKIDLRGEPKSATFAKNEETGDTVVSFGKAGAKK